MKLPLKILSHRWISRWDCNPSRQWTLKNEIRQKSIKFVNQISWIIWQWVTHAKNHKNKELFDISLNSPHSQGFFCLHSSSAFACDQNMAEKTRKLLNKSIQTAKYFRSKQNKNYVRNIFQQNTTNVVTFEKFSIWKSRFFICVVIVKLNF